VSIASNWNDERNNEAREREREGERDRERKRKRKRKRARERERRRTRSFEKYCIGRSAAIYHALSRLKFAWYCF